MGFHHCESDAFLSIGSLPAVSVVTDIRPDQRRWTPLAGATIPEWMIQGFSFRISKIATAGEWIIRGTGSIEPNEPPNAGVYGDHPGAPWEMAYLGWNYNELNHSLFTADAAWELDITTKEGSRIHLRMKVHTVTLLDTFFEQITVETLNGHDLSIEIQFNIEWNALGNFSPPGIDGDDGIPGSIATVGGDGADGSDCTNDSINAGIGSAIACSEAGGTWDSVCSVCMIPGDIASNGTGGGPGGDGTNGTDGDDGTDGVPPGCGGHGGLGSLGARGGRAGRGGRGGCLRLVIDVGILTCPHPFGRFIPTTESSPGSSSTQGATGANGANGADGAPGNLT